MRKHIRISVFNATLIFGAITALCLGAILIASTTALRELRVGGPLYSQIKLGSDLVADVLPPPAYVIEAYLEATLALRNPPNVEAHKLRLASLYKDYLDRQAFWRQAALEPALKSELTVASDAKAQEFWKVVERELLPALERSDAVWAEDAYLRLAIAYGQHRTIIDDIVSKATKMNSALEAFVDARVADFSKMVWIVFAVAVTIIVLGIVAIAAGVVRPTVHMTKIMRRLAGGELEVAIPSLTRKDEIGDMAKAVVVFRENAVQNRDQAVRERAAEAEARNRLEREVTERTRDLKRLAMSDALTGLANRRRLLERIEAEVANSADTGDDLAVLYIDIDRFKHINDTYGHATGDAALIEVAKVLKGSLRRTDFVGRLGGEEFVVLLNGTSESDAFQIAEAIRQRVSQHQSKELPIHITVSIGISAYRPKDTVSSLLARADHAMLDAKNDGRNLCRAAA